MRASILLTFAAIIANPQLNRVCACTTLYGPLFFITLLISLTDLEFEILITLPPSSFISLS